MFHSMPIEIVQQTFHAFEEPDFGESNRRFFRADMLTRRTGTAMHSNQARRTGYLEAKAQISPVSSRSTCTRLPAS